MSSLTIIRPKWLMINPQTVLENHSLIIQNELILEVIPNHEVEKKYSVQPSQKYDSHLVMPGFVNTHTHLGMNLFRGLADDLSLMNWLNNHIWPAEKEWLNEEFVRDASMLAMAEMIRSGTTCYNDMYFFLQAIAEATEQSGMRGFIGMTIMDFPTAWAQDADEYFKKGLEFYEAYKNHKRITATLAPHAIYTVCDKNLIKVKDFAEKYDLKINMHVQETADEVTQSLKKTGLRPIKRLHEMEFISPRLIAIHMTQISEEDLEILAQDKPNLVHCPESNMKLASGACPVSTLQTIGINVALGTDSVASNNDLDMISEMRSAAFLGKLITQDPECLSAETVIDMATYHGAKALGIDHLVGSLDSGKCADFIAIDFNEIETQPLYHPASQLVYSASRNQVTDVWVCGKQLMKNRELLTLDENELKAKAKKWQEKIIKSS